MPYGFFLLVLVFEITLAGTCGRVDRECPQGRCGDPGTPAEDMTHAVDVVAAAQAMEEGELPECDFDVEAYDEDHARVFAADVEGLWRVVFVDADGRLCVADE